MSQLRSHSKLPIESVAAASARKQMLFWVWIWVQFYSFLDLNILSLVNIGMWNTTWDILMYSIAFP